MVSLCKERGVNHCIIGNDFLTKFQASMVNVPILEDLTIIDTPGVLSGEKQRLGRSYGIIDHSSKNYIVV